MARTRKITDEQILKAAQAVFLENGFGASTIEIAERAGISEGSIFKRFNTKENLFLMAMGMSDFPPWLPILESMVGQGVLKDNLKDLALKMIEFFQENLPKMMMVMSKGGPLPNIMRATNAPPIRNLKGMTRFFEQEIALGRMQASNPQTVAQIFMGSLMNYVFLDQLSAPLAEPHDYVDAMVETLWQGLKPSS